MAGLTKAQRAAKEAAAEELKVDESITETKVETIVDNTVVKYRCDFKSYAEYSKYPGRKG